MDEDDKKDAERYRALRPYITKLLVGVSMTPEQTDVFMDEFIKKMDAKVKEKVKELRGR